MTCFILQIKPNGEEKTLELSFDSRKSAQEWVEQMNIGSEGYQYKLKKPAYTAGVKRELKVLA